MNIGRVKLCLLLAMSVIVLTVVVAAVSTGYVYRTEFSPDLLKFRSNNYFGLECLVAHQEEWSTALMDRIRKYEHLCKPPNAQPRWHFVHGKMRGIKGWIGEAKPAYRYLRNEHFNYGGDWLEWTDKNPALAERLWPKVINLLRDEQYDAILIAMFAAKEAIGAEDFERAFAEVEKKFR